MKQWVKDAHRTIRTAREHATRTADPRLHMACARAIDAMVADGLLMPSELRTYARQMLTLYSVENQPETKTLAEVAGSDR
jgi:hypothetical protein